MLLDLHGNSAQIGQFQFAFQDSNQLVVSQQKLLIRITDQPQAQITRVGFQLYLTQNFAFAPEMNTVYAIADMRNLGIVQFAEPPLNIFEAGQALVLHFRDVVVSFRNAQLQRRLEMQVASCCSYRDGVLIAQANSIQVFSAALQVVGCTEVRMDASESIQQVQACDNTVILLTTSSRILVGACGSKDFVEVFKGERIQRIESGPFIKGVLLAVLDQQTLRILSVFPSGSGAKVIFCQRFEEVIRGFHFAPRFAEQPFLKQVNCVGAVVADKIQALCLEESDLFTYACAQRDIVGEYQRLKQLYEELCANQQPVRELTSSIDLSCEASKSEESIILTISSPSYLIYCDVAFPPGLHVSSGYFDVITPHVLRVFNRDKIQLQFGMLPGFKYYAKNEFRICAVADSYVSGLKTVVVDEFFTFRPIAKLPRVPVFVSASVSEFLPNFTISAPADFFQCETRDDISYIKASSLTTAEGFLDQFAQRKNLSMKISTDGFLARLSAFAKVFQGKAAEFEHWKLQNDIRLWAESSNFKVDMVGVSRGLGLIQSGLWGSCEMGVQKIREALGM